MKQSNTKIAIIKYNAGNIRSVDFALKRLGVNAEITDDFDTIRAADKVIFPGVGEASSTMHFLQAQGMDTVLKNLEQPVLGICLGLQLMCKYSEEGDTTTMGLFDARVRKFKPGLKIPHIGWNQIYNLQTPLFEGIAEGSFVYFVHSFYAEECEESIALCKYGETFSAAMKSGHFYATQFHPEKSGEIGAGILKNFINL